LYIAGCLSERLNPRAAYVIRSDISQELHLEHFGMGDIMAEQLAPGIRALPMLFYINISDNNLTDKGMEALLSSVIDMPMLTVLNMSDNEIGPVTAKALQEYLSGEERCPLQTLILKNANVDDFEGAMFIRSLQNNKTLTELNLSNNLIGGAEILNVVQPDLITAVESLADLIQNSECVLKTVELAWNCMRRQCVLMLLFSTWI
jgi:Ran GTPase-activating protein (RanGAP) involved in mRNA processing and transport